MDGEGDTITLLKIRKLGRCLRTLKNPIVLKMWMVKAEESVEKLA